jgi:hypothetical protein
MDEQLQEIKVMESSNKLIVNPKSTQCSQITKESFPHWMMALIKKITRQWIFHTSSMQYKKEHIAMT